jgi:hypothetical protein
MSQIVPANGNLLKIDCRYDLIEVCSYSGFIEIHQKRRFVPAKVGIYAYAEDGYPPMPV